MRERRNSEVERRRQSNIQTQRRPQQKAKQSKKNKKETKAPIIICLILGISIGWITEFDIKGFIENISKYKIAIVKKEDEQDTANGSSNKDQQSAAEEVASNEDVKSETSTVEQEPQQQKQEPPKETKQDKINKAKQAIINQCGGFNDVAYGGEGPHPTKGTGNYYIFNMGEEVTGDMVFYVDVNTYKVYEYSVDGYFGKYRDGNSNVFTYDMAVRKLENELGWDENRRYGLMEEKSDGYIIRTGFETEGGTGTGETYYVTRESIDVYGWE